MCTINDSETDGSSLRLVQRGSGTSNRINSSSYSSGDQIKFEKFQPNACQDLLSVPHDHMDALKIARVSLMDTLV